MRAPLTVPAEPSTNGEGRDAPMLSDGKRLALLIEEYKALYTLVVYRMTSLEQRVAVVTAILAATVTASASLQTNFQLPVLIGLPVVLLFLFESTINHARSFEDILRRIDEIERAVNSIAQEVLLAFQSQHPSKGKAVGGRIGSLSVRYVLIIATMLLLGGSLAFRGLALSLWVEAAYSGICIVILIYMAFLYRKYLRYRYKRTSHLSARDLRP